MQTPVPEEIVFTREQFYEKVWSIPATKLAIEFGISDVLIGKICKAYKIPKPYCGYWAKLKYGKNPEQTPLPENNDAKSATLTFFKYADQKKSIAGPEPAYDSDIQEMLDRALTMEPIVVSESLRNPHPLVAATRDRIKRDSIPYHLRSYDEPRDRRPTLNIDVGRDSTSRALRIMNALINRIEKIGGCVEVRKERWNEHRTQTIVVFGGEDVAVLWMGEKRNQVRIEPGNKEYSWRSIELQPNGLLFLRDGSSYYNSTFLRDTPKRRRIEDGLDNLVIGFVKKAGQLRIDRREEEAARKQREEEERIRRQKEEQLQRLRDDLAQRQKAERARVYDLVNRANSWRKSQLIRDYLDALSAMLFKRGGTIAIDGEDAEYLRWGYRQADRLDPFGTNWPSVLDERV